MKILFTITIPFNPNQGGVQRTTYKLGRYFTENGLEVHYHSLADSGHVPAEFGTLHHVNRPGTCNNKDNLNDLQSVLREVKPDVVINQMPYEAPLRELLRREKQDLDYLLLGCLRNALFSVKNNLSGYTRRVLPRFMHPFMDNRVGHALLFFYHRTKHARDLRRILDEHDYFILLSPPNREELQFFVGDYKAHKVENIPNSIPGVDEQAVTKEKTLLFVGRLNIPQKRVDLLLPAWREIYPQLPDWEFVIVGDGPYRDTMESQIREWNLPRVRLAGFQKPESYYRKSSLFIMPSAYEGFPNVLLEAQSFGVVPVVFDNYPALSWIVAHGQDASLVEPFDTRAMAAEIVRLAHDTETREGMRRAALKNAGKFTIDKVGEQWLEFFKSARK